jgi:hypothetical protein
MWCCSLHKELAVRLTGARRHEPLYLLLDDPDKGDLRKSSHILVRGMLCFCVPRRVGRTHLSGRLPVFRLTAKSAVLNRRSVFGVGVEHLPERLSGAVCTGPRIADARVAEIDDRAVYDISM